MLGLEYQVKLRKDWNGKGTSLLNRAERDDEVTPPCGVALHRCSSLSHPGCSTMPRKIFTIFPQL